MRSLTHERLGGLGRAMVNGVILLVAGAAGLGSPAGALEPSRFAEVRGFDQGTRIVMHADMMVYLNHLEEASPRVAVVRQGLSWEGRQLPLAVVTSPANHARIEAIRANGQRLWDPRRTSPEEARSLIENQPVILYFGGSIHGFELSGSEALIRLLEHLATREDAQTLEVLDNAVVLIDPMLNPDGRDAFAQRNHESIGRVPSSQPDDWSNDFTSWEAVRFRTGHYFFDTNRDWWAQTQRETRLRAPTLHAWRPQVVVDLHEMGPDVEFFFDPPAEPFGPFFPEFTKRWFGYFGASYADAFDEAGFEYMTGERYNYFYPGYTDSYGTYQGAVGMLYEQGSTRGLALERSDQSVRRLEDALEQQYTAAWTAIKTAAQRRRELLEEYYESLEAAVEMGQQGITRYLLEPGGDPQLMRELVSLLRRNSIEVGYLEVDTRLAGVRDRTGRQVGERTFPRGTFVVEAAQPLSRLVRMLLEPTVPLRQDFLDEARAKVERGEDPRFYDVTAWSLPLLFNQRGFSSTDPRQLDASPIESAAVRRSGNFPEAARYAYVIEGRQAAGMAALVELKNRGFRAAVTLKPTRVEGHELASGSVVLRVGQNGEDLHASVAEVAESFDLEVVSMTTGLAEPGFPALGSADVVPVRQPEIGLLAGEPIHGYSFGWAWYTLDQQFRIPVTVRQIGSLASRPIDHFNVLILPNLMGAEGVDDLAGRLGAKGVARLRQWIEDGGSLVSLGESGEFVRRHLGFTGLRSWYEEEQQLATERRRLSPGEADEVPESPEEQRFDVPGAILGVELDSNQWLAAGYEESYLPAQVDSSRVLLAPLGPPSTERRVVGRYAAAGELLLSGHIWPESRERLPGSVFAYEEKIGTGRVIVFVEDLNFRGYWRGANRLFLNSVVLAPSAP